jgi:hypothetical protein
VLVAAAACSRPCPALQATQLAVPYPLRPQLGSPRPAQEVTDDARMTLVQLRSWLAYGNRPNELVVGGCWLLGWLPPSRWLGCHAAAAPCMQAAPRALPPAFERRAHRMTACRLCS